MAGFVARVRGQRDELVAAEPRDHLAGGGGAGLEPVGDLDQEPVAGGVAEAVVDGLEPVQVQVAEGEVAVGPGDGLLQPLEEEGAVGQPGERVVGRLVPQAQVEQAALGGVLQQRQLVLGFAVGVAEQGDGEVGPQDRAVAAEEGLLDAVALPLAAHQFAVEVPDVRRVVGVDPLGEVAADRVAEPAEHADQGVVGLQHPAVQRGDGDADGGALEDGAEADLAVVQGLGDGAARVEGRAGDRLLFGEGAVAQRAGVPGGHPVLEAGAPGALLLAVAVGAAVQHQVGVDHVEAAAERLGVGAVGGHQGGARVLPGLGLQGAVGERLAEPAGQRQELFLQFGAGAGGGRHRVDGAAPDRGEPAQAVLRLGPRAHAARPTPPKPEKAYGCSSSTSLSGRQRGSGTRPGSTSSTESRKRAMPSRERSTSGARTER